MDSRLRRGVGLWTTAAALAGLMAACAPTPRAQNPMRTEETDVRWGRVSVQLPTSTTRFPAAQGADIANDQCLTCHSADMVLHQPARTPAEWQATINKMRSAYGAPLPAEQVGALAAYLSTLMGEGAPEEATTRK